MAQSNIQPIWVPPVYYMSTSPELLASVNLVPDPTPPSNFARSSKWCPDGSVALTHCENRSFQFLKLPTEIIDSVLYRTILHQPASVLDFLWYPTASIRDPSSFCFAASVRECPVKLLDASDGRLRASYSIVDHRERQISPHSLAFNLTATKLYCGFEDAIEIFDVGRPGVDQGTRLHTTPSKKSKDGLKGIISALSFCPDPSADYFAAGSLTSSCFNISLFSESTGEKPLMWVGAKDLASGVTQLKFNPMNPAILYASFRRRPEIYSWDLRGDSSIPLQIFQPGERDYEPTNQKLKFDVDLGGKWLGVGDQRGDVSIFDIAGGQDNEDRNGAETKSPALQYHAHSDAVGSVAFHPIRPLLLSVSGSRHFDTDYSDESDSESSDGEHSVAIKRRTFSTRDSTIRFWSFMESNTDGP